MADAAAPHGSCALLGRGRFRVTEIEQARMGCKPYSNFNLVGAAQVGKSSLTGMRVLHALSGAVPVWPEEAQSTSEAAAVVWAYVATEPPPGAFPAH